MTAKIFTQAEFNDTPGAVVHHAVHKGPATVVNDAGEPVFTVGGPADPDLEARISDMEAELAEALGYPDPSDIEAASWDRMLEDVRRLAVPRGDPADAAAWPLPEGWRWNARYAWRTSDSFTVWVDWGGLQFLRVSPSSSESVPFAVLDVLRARWEAGQA